MDSIKEYLISVGLKKYAPIGIMWAMTALGAYLAAHAGMLEQWGITYGTWPLHWAQDPTGPCIVIELDTVSASAITGVAGLVAIIIRATQHHVLPSQPPQEVAK